MIEPMKRRIIRRFRLDRHATFTFSFHCAYMTAMGFPALKERLEVLNTETRTRSEAVARAGEVLSFSLATVVRSADAIVASQKSLRLVFLNGAHDIDALLAKDFNTSSEESLDLEKAADLLADMKRFCRRVSRPYMADASGFSLLSSAEKIEGIKGATSSDGRLMRRLGGRIRATADNCDKQRARFHAVLNRAIALVEKAMANSADVEAVHKANIAAIAKASIKRFPKVNAYLAN